MGIKIYPKPTIVRRGIFAYSGGYLGFGKETPRWLHIKEDDCKKI